MCVFVCVCTQVYINLKYCLYIWVAGISAIVCLALTIWFAQKSLQHKLECRKLKVSKIEEGRRERVGEGARLLGVLVGEGDEGRGGVELEDRGRNEGDGEAWEGDQEGGRCM